MSEVAAVGGKKLKKAVKPKQKAGVNKMQMLIMRPELINMIPVIKYNRNSKDHKGKLVGISQTLRTKFASNARWFKCMERVR